MSSSLRILAMFTCAWMFSVVTVGIVGAAAWEAIRYVVVCGADVYHLLITS